MKIDITPEQMTDNDIMTKIIPNRNDYKFKTFLQQAKKKPPMKQIFGNYFQTGEICILAGKTGVGKSTLAYTIADGITKGIDILKQPNEAGKQSVLYYDFELKERQIVKRFPDYEPPDNFERPDVSQILLKNDGIFDFEVIRNDLINTGIKVLIIDNITAIALKSLSDGTEALNIMKQLVLIRDEFDISILVLAHTPKIRENRPLELYDIAGSSFIHNFIDSALIVQKSSQSVNQRYLKQVKTRNAVENDNVLVFDIIHDGWLHCQFNRFDREENHLNINPDYLIKKKNELIEIAETIISNGSIRYNDFCNRYAKEYGKTFDNGKKKLHQLLKENLIIKTPDNTYMINRNEVPEEKSSGKDEPF